GCPGGRLSGGRAAGLPSGLYCTVSRYRVPYSLSVMPASRSAYLSSTHWTAKGFGVLTISVSLEIEIARVGASQVRKACSGSADRASSRICDQTSEAVSSMNSREEQRDFWVRRTRQARPRLWKSQPENRSLPAPPNTATEH